MFFPFFSLWGFWRTAPGLLALSEPAAQTTGINRAGELWITSSFLNYSVPKEGKKPEEWTDYIARSATLAGLPGQKGTFPGPIINATKGDVITINVVNKLENKALDLITSIHWHGIEQRHQNWADGTAFVTQCPIPPQKSFLYNYSVPNQAGTFWYHSHWAEQYCDGLRGPLIIRDPNDPHISEYNVDNDLTVLTLADWFRKRAPTGPSTFDLTLINGQTRAVVSVEPGKKYRFRMISMACAVAWQFSIDNHPLTVIEVEGVSVEKYQTDVIPIHAGQRYSFVLSTKEKKNYGMNHWIRAEVPKDDSNGTIHNGYPGRALLHYTNARDSGPSFPEYPPPSRKRTLEEQELKASPLPQYIDLTLTGPDIPEEKIHRQILEFQESPRLINNVSYVNPTIPVLLQILNGTNPRDLIPKGSLIEIPKDKVIEVSFRGIDYTLGNPHPMHLHGHTFAVVRSINQTGYNLPNPPQRDTVGTSLFNPPKGKNTSDVAIRFKSDNPGPWILHCHIDSHLAMGMAVVLVEKSEEVKEETKPNEAALKQSCDEFTDWYEPPF